MCFEGGVGGQSAGFVDDEWWCFGFGGVEFVLVLVEVVEDVEDLVGGLGVALKVGECFEAFEAGCDDKVGVDGGDGVVESLGAGFGFGGASLEAVWESAAVGESAEDVVGCADVVEDLEGGADGLG